MSAETIREALVFQANAQPEAPAILAAKKTPLTYGQLLAQTNSVGLALCGDIKPGSRVGLLIDSPDSLATAILSVASFTAVAPVNLQLTDENLVNLIANFGLKLLLIENGLDERYHRVAQTTGIDTVGLNTSPEIAGGFEICRAAEIGKDNYPPAEPNDIAFVMHTSSSTASPKTITWKQRSSLIASTRIRTRLRVTSADRVLNALPMYHSAGLNELMTAISVGASTIATKFAIRAFIDLLEEYRPTWFTLTPAMLQMVLGSSNDLPSAIRHRLRFIRSSSSVLPPLLRERIEDLFGTTVVNGYGSSETNTIALTGLDPDDRRENAVGRIVHDGVSIRNAEGARIQHPEVGEVWVTGPTVIAGYDNDENVDRDVFRDGWYRTGDEGFLDDDGFLYLVGRISESIDRGGEKIALDEVDMALTRHEQVAEAASFGVPHEKLGQEIWAAVVPTKGTDLDANQVRAFASSVLTFAKTPKRVFIIDQLPLGSTGKVLRSTLAEKFGRRSNSEISGP